MSKYKYIFVYTHRRYIAHSQLFFEMVKISQSQYICSNFFHIATYTKFIPYSTTIQSCDCKWS